MKKRDPSIELQKSKVSYLCDAEYLHLFHAGIYLEAVLIVRRRRILFHFSSFVFTPQIKVAAPKTAIIPLSFLNSQFFGWGSTKVAQSRFVRVRVPVPICSCEFGSNMCTTSLKMSDSQKTPEKLPNHFLLFLF